PRQQAPGDPRRAATLSRGTHPRRARRSGSFQTRVNVGILGGGQLGRMLALAGYPLGLRFRVLDPSPEAGAGRLAEHVVGDYLDPDALERFARGLDVVTY